MHRIRLSVGLLAVVVLAVGCSDSARFNLSGSDAPALTVAGVTVGDVTITADTQCGGNKITKITGAGTTAYAGQKTANYSLTIERQPGCDYVGFIQLGFPGEDPVPPASDYPICTFGINGGVSPTVDGGVHGVTGVSGVGVGNRCPNITLQTYTLLDSGYRP